MSEFIRVRLLLAQMHEDTEPCVVAAVDESIWAHWADDEEAAWIAQGKRTWGVEIDTEFKVVVAKFAPDDLVEAFKTPEAIGAVEHGASEVAS